MKIDNNVIGIYNKNFKKCIGTGRLDLAFREDYQSNLKLIQKEIGFETIRGHGIFSNQMSVYHESVQAGASAISELENPIFVFKEIIRVIDIFLENNIEPFIEIGFMPDHLAINTETVFWWKGNVTEPKSVEIWQNLLKEFINVLFEYYGREKVRSWYFEIWNEPNCNFFAPENGDRESSYRELYKNSVKAIKSIDKELKVGGPATNESGRDWLEPFIEWCYVENVEIDFLSHHIYTAHNRKFEGEYASLELYPKEIAKRKFEDVKNIVANSKIPQLEIHLTEWNTSFSCIDLLHDSALQGAYLGYLLAHIDDTASSYAYWVFCDVFEEGGVPRALFHGGFGLLTVNGIRKNAYYAFYFANKLYENIVFRNDKLIVTTNNFGYRIMAFNPQDEVAKENLSFEVAFKKAVCFVEEVDEVNANAYLAYCKLGSPRWPKKEEMEIIKKSQYPKRTLEVLDVVDNEISIDISIGKNGLKFIDIREL